jgi:hypothetical protein
MPRPSGLALVDNSSIRRALGPTKIKGKSCLTRHAYNRKFYYVTFDDERIIECWYNLTDSSESRLTYMQTDRRTDGLCNGHLSK